MYSATLELNELKFVGTLDFHTLKMTQISLIKLDKKLTIPQIIESIANFDVTVMILLIYQSIHRGSGISEDEFLRKSMNDCSNEDLLTRYSCFFEYIADLFSLCLPKSEESESEFEDIPDEFTDKDKDWDLSYMEYLWMSTLKRSNFWETTPKNFFEQIEIHRKLNSPQKEDVEEL